MAKIISTGKGLLSVLFWSVIAAAFIGPGTVTTAARAGASFQYQLLWALVFSTIATIILQEAAARITIASGKSLGEVLAQRYRGSGQIYLRWLLAGSVVLGCAAYEAGNFLGAIAGLQLWQPWPTPILVIALAAVVGLLLWQGKLSLIARFLGLVVGLMGLLFMTVAFRSDVSWIAVTQGALLPQIPAGSALLIIGLVGTTIVPYNLFLASGLSKGQDIREMRIGVSLAVIIGGLISMAILLSGSLLKGEFGFSQLAGVLGEQLGSWASVCFALGLFAAGWSSALTAPMAAAIAAQSLFGYGPAASRWSNQGTNFRLVWMGVLACGLVFGLLGAAPVPTIILAQAFNGLLLPLVTVVIALVVNDPQILPKSYLNKWPANILLLLVTGVVTYLGAHNLWKAVQKTWSSSPDVPFLLWLVTGAVVLWLARRMVVLRREATKL